MDQFSFSASARFGALGPRPYMLIALDKRLTEIFTDQSEPGTPLRDRWRYVAALGALADFMRHTGFAMGTVENWIELGLALKELDHGIIREFLKPNKSGSRAQDPSDIWLARTYIAIAMDLVDRDGHGPRESAKHIAKANFFLQPILSPRSRDLPGAIRSWIRRLRAGTVNDDRANRIFAERHRFQKFAAETLRQKGEEISPPAVAAQLIYEAGMIATRAANSKAIAELKPILRGKRSGK